jgi:hypothetical protein
MNDDQLDDEIRALMSAVVAEAPAPKPLPPMDGVPAAPVESMRRGRGRAMVWTGIAVAASLVAFAVFWSSRNDHQSVIAATSSTVADTTILSLTTTTAPVDRSQWPTGVTAVVASDRGIETIAAENGETVVTQLADANGGGGFVVRAYIGTDGQRVASYCCQESALPHIWVTAEDGTGQPIDETGGTLLDVAADGAVLYATGGVNSRLMLWVDGERSQLSMAPDSAREVAADFHFQGDFVVGSWGEAGQLPFAVDRAGQQLDMGVAMGSVATATGPGMQEARLDLDGQLTVTDGVSQKVVEVDTDGVIALDVRWPFVLVSYRDAQPQLIDVVTGTLRVGPVADGIATFSMKAPSTAVPTEFPEGEVRAVVTQRDSDADDGVWIVTADQFVQVDGTAGGPAFLAGETLLFSPKAGGVVAIDRTTGTTETLRATGQVVDAAVLGGELYYLYTDYVAGVFTSLYLHGPEGDTYIAADDGSDTGHLSWHLGRGIIVGTGAFYPSLPPEFYDFAGNALEELSTQFAPATLPPDGSRMLYSLSPDGTWGIVDGDLLTLRQWDDPAVLDTITIPDGISATRLDVSADRIVVTYNLGTNGADAAREATRNADGTWTWSDLPGSGWATLPRTVDPGAPAAVTPITEPPYTPSVALAGPGGVRVIVGDGSERVITTDASTRVVLRRNGDVSFRSPSFGAYPREWVQATGEIHEHWAGTNWVAEPILHDDLGALGGDFLFSVADQVYRYSDERRWSAPGAADTRLSCSYDGWVIGNGVRFAMGDSQPPEWLGAAGGEWALTPDGTLAGSTTDGLIRVRRTSDGVVVYEQAIGDRVISEIDISGEWLAYIETPGDTPAADATSRAVLVHLPSGRSIAYDDVVSLSLPNTDI